MIKSQATVPFAKKANPFRSKKTLEDLVCADDGPVYNASLEKMGMLPEFMDALHHWLKMVSCVKIPIQDLLPAEIFM